MSSDEERRQLEIAVRTGIEAEKLLSNELLSSLFFSRKNQACESFMRTQQNDHTKRSELWADVQGVIKIEQELQQLVESGKIARQNLSEFEGSLEIPMTYDSFEE